MRLAAQARLGYYPAPPEVMALVLRHLRMPEGKADQVRILDPCAGQGAAVKDLADGLGVPYGRVYCIELDGGRSAAIADAMPFVNLLPRCSYMGSQVTPGSMSLVYCNPPFDDELGGGGREELRFASLATMHVAVNGVCVFVLPWSTFANWKTLDYLDMELYDTRAYKFPDEQSRFNEVVVIGLRRKFQLPPDSLDEHGVFHKAGFGESYYLLELYHLTEIGSPSTPMEFTRGGPYGTLQVTHGEPEPEIKTWTLCPTQEPRTFKKVSFTPEELLEAIGESPLNAMLTSTRPTRLPRPPLSLAKGHVALLLASGVLDGPVTLDGQTHVVRGTSRKEQYVSDRTVTENEETGDVTEKVTTSERIVLTIRAVDNAGVIHTFTDTQKIEDEDDGNGDSATISVEVVEST